MDNKFQDSIDVLKYQREKIKDLDDDYSEINDDIKELERKVHDFMKEENIIINEELIDTNLTEKNKCVEQIYENEKVENFKQLLKKAHSNGYKNMDLYEIATEEEVKEANDILQNVYSEYLDEYKLDKYDYAIAGIVGCIAAAIDLFLVTQQSIIYPKGPYKTVPGKITTENYWDKILSEENIRNLEKKYKATYDVPLNNDKLSKKITGLWPNYHRFQSLGHDPILGFVYGVSDLMNGKMTAIDTNGKMVVRAIENTEGQGFIQAIITVFGHLLSDVSAKSKTGKVLSIPAPLTPLLQLINTGSVEYKGSKLTIADLSRQMYYDGYNFNHFIGMSIPIMMIEVLVRASYVIKEIFFVENKNLKVRNNPKITVMLTIANGILFAENTGKLIITKNPFSVNYVVWLNMIKYGLKTLKWQTYGKQLGKIDYAQKDIDNCWEELIISTEIINEPYEI